MYAYLIGTTEVPRRPPLMAAIVGHQNRTSGMRTAMVGLCVAVLVGSTLGCRTMNPSEQLRDQVTQEGLERGLELAIGAVWSGEADVEIRVLDEEWLSVETPHGRYELRTDGVPVADVPTPAGQPTTFTVSADGLDKPEQKIRYVNFERANSSPEDVEAFYSDLFRNRGMSKSEIAGDAARDRVSQEIKAAVMPMPDGAEEMGMNIQVVDHTPADLGTRVLVFENQHERAYVAFGPQSGVMVLSYARCERLAEVLYAQ